MPRGGRSLGGGRSSGGSRGGSGAASRLSAAAESRRTIPVVAHRPSSGWSRWLSGETSDCRSLYRYYMMGVRKLKEGENDSYCIHKRQQLEDFCSQYKPLWSGWWTEKDDKRSCQHMREVYNYCVANNKGTPEIHTSLKEAAERACSVVQSTLPSSSSPSLMGYLTTTEVLDYCI